MQADPGLLQLRHGYLYRAALNSAIEKVKGYVKAECSRQKCTAVGVAICTVLEQTSRKCTRTNDFKIHPSAVYQLASWASQLDERGDLAGSIAAELRPSLGAAAATAADAESRGQKVDAFLVDFRKLMQNLKEGDFNRRAQAFRQALQRGLENLATSDNTEGVCALNCEAVAQRAQWLHANTYGVCRR